MAPPGNLGRVDLGLQPGRSAGDRHHGQQPEPDVTPGYIQLINNYHGRVGSDFTPSHNPNTRTNFAASYVTGSHAFKAGEDFGWAKRGAWTGSIVPYSYSVSTNHGQEMWVSPCPRT